MIIQEVEIKEKELPLLQGLKRNKVVYEIYKYVEKTQACTINEIQEYTGANLKTVYKHINRLYKKGLIGKDFTQKNQRDRSHFLILANSTLKNELKKIENILNDFIEIGS
ncbi:MAG: winged helix-turn-helix transcriptional regulator [Candidatus Thorarchaeota archaeon]